MKIEQIDPTKELKKEEFCALFEQLPLNDLERNSVKVNYWPIYEICLSNPDVTPAEAWVAAKNTFIIKEVQVGERMQQQSENLSL